METRIESYAPYNTNDEGNEKTFVKGAYRRADWLANEILFISRLAVFFQTVQYISLKYVGHPLCFRKPHDFLEALFSVTFCHIVVFYTSVCITRNSVLQNFDLIHLKCNK